MSEIKFRLMAYTGAAGKFNPAAPNEGNEDNFYVDDNLSDNIPNHFVPDAVIEMAECGLILVVADGMGGQNAGDVASSIAVHTIYEYFAPEHFDTKAAQSPLSRKAYLEKVVAEADLRIKNESKSNPEHEGMGTTIILAWIVNDDLTLTWCGDSRAYRFNPKIGIQLLSEDHSFVQNLVKEGLLTYDDTFDHPQGNIVTRSLGDPQGKAQPETRQFKLYNSDIILLCSDGLSGVLRDKKTKSPDGDYYPGDNIEDVIRQNMSSMKACKDALWDAAERADWYDNVTTILCQIMEGADGYPDEIADKIEDTETDTQTPVIEKGFWNKTLHFKVKPKWAILFLLIAVVGIIAAGTAAFYWKRQPNTESRPVERPDSLPLPDTTTVVQPPIEKVVEKPIQPTTEKKKEEVIDSTAKEQEIKENELTPYVEPE